MAFHYAPRLSEDQVVAWREFARQVDWAHYSQDPVWAETERCKGRSGSGEPWFFWAETEGSLRLTAVGMRRRLPLPRGVFWQFKKGPNFLDTALVDEWMAWLLSSMGRDLARIRLSPAIPLQAGGDDVETLLERRGLSRHRIEGGWATLRLDIARDEDEIFAGFRPATQRAIKKSVRAGIEVECEDEPRGWEAIAELQRELSLTATVPFVDLASMEGVSRDWLCGGSGGTVLVARHRGEAIAAALVVIYHGVAYLPVIPSSRRHRELPAAHFLVWEAIRWAKAHGCTTFDFEGYSLVAEPGDPLWGINQFKRGYASQDDVVKSVAVHEIILSPAVVSIASAGLRGRTWLSRRRPSPSSVRGRAPDAAPAREGESNRRPDESPDAETTTCERQERGRVAVKEAGSVTPGLLSRVLTVGEWNIGIARASVHELVLGDDAAKTVVADGDVRWLPKPWFVRFQADPCLIERDGRFFLYYEEMRFGSIRGRLRFVELDADGRPIGRSSAMIRLRHHASYPYVFSYEGELYCVPETGRRSETILYKGEGPLGPWKRHSVLLDGVPTRDSTLVAHQGRWWLFCTVAGHGAGSQFSALHIWHAPEPWGPWEAHRLQPAKKDVRSARPAGRPFVVDGRLYRPAQDCGARYGARTVINRVLVLTPDDFAEEVCHYLSPCAAGPYGEGLHTVTGAGGLLAIDGYRDRVSANPYKIVTSLIVEASERLFVGE